MCSYRIAIAAPEFCSNPAFGFLLKATTEQTYNLQISRLEDSSLLCSVEHSGYGPTNGLSFKSFSLAFDSIPSAKYKARHPGRVLFDDEEIYLSEKGIESTSTFTNTLHYASISSERSEYEYN